jgi:hypothetical protein
MTRTTVRDDRCDAGEEYFTHPSVSSFVHWWSRPAANPKPGPRSAEKSGDESVKVTAASEKKEGNVPCDEGAPRWG